MREPVFAAGVERLRFERRVSCTPGAEGAPRLSGVEVGFDAVGTTRRDCLGGWGVSFGDYTCCVDGTDHDGWFVVLGSLCATEVGLGVWVGALMMVLVVLVGNGVDHVGEWVLSMEVRLVVWCGVCEVLRWSSACLSFRQAS